MHRKHLAIFSLLFILVLSTSCGAQQQTKNDFIARYYIATKVPADSSASTLKKIKQASDWVLSLEDNDNFELTGTGKKVVGFWDIQKINDKEYKLFLQGGGWAIYGRFDGTTIYFDKRYKMFDELFSEISFARKKK